MATESDMIAMRAELTNLTTTVKTMEDRLQNQLDPKIVQYDEMLTSFETLSGSWKEEVQRHIVATDEKRNIADGKFADLYSKASASISEVNGRLAAADAQIAALTALTSSGGKGKGGNKWEFPRPKDIEPSTFGWQGRTLGKVERGDRGLCGRGARRLQTYIANHTGNLRV